jgi:hypothetical protein
MNNVCQDLSVLDKEIDLPKFLEQLDNDPELYQYLFRLHSEPNESQTEFNYSSMTVSDFSDNDERMNVNEGDNHDPLVIFEKTEVINDIVQGLRESGTIRVSDFSDGELKQGLEHSLPILPSSKESASSVTVSIEIVSGISDNVMLNKRRKQRGSYKGTKKHSWTQTRREEESTRSSTVLDNTAEQKRNPMVPFKVTALVARECQVNPETIREIEEENDIKIEFPEKLLEPTRKPKKLACKTTALKARIAIVSPDSKSRKIVRVNQSKNETRVCFCSDEEEVLTLPV